MSANRVVSLVLVATILTIAFALAPSRPALVAASEDSGIVAYVRRSTHDIHLISPDGTDDQVLWTAPQPLSLTAPLDLAWRLDGGGLVPLLTWTVYWLALAFLCIGMIRSNVYSLGLGWMGLVLSIGVVTLGVVQIFTARSTILTLIFAVLMLLTALWDLAVGIWVARRAW